MLLCDGAVRSGKTVCMGLSFFLWAMRRFQGESFALCGKTGGGVRRNVLEPVAPMLRELGFRLWERRSEGVLWAEFNGRRNRFYLFGGRDEGAAGRIQGVTLAGALLDEAALMPRSFVEQAMARCSAEGAKVWLTCNPEGPEHWLYREWILRAAERNALRLRFRMEDNPGLSSRVRERYRRMYTGDFYRRYVLGEWTAAQGLVYDGFGPACIGRPEGDGEEFAISCDYGTRNPASFGLWAREGAVWYRVREFYHDSRRTGRQMTDQEYAEALEDLAGGRPVRAVVVDPSAASFLELLRRRGWPVVKAANDVLAGIRLVARLLREGRIRIAPECGDALREFGLYRWQDGAGGRDRVRKEDDHAMDDIRYFAATLLAEREPAVSAGYVERGRF